MKNTTEVCPEDGGVKPPKSVQGVLSYFNLIWHAITHMWPLIIVEVHNIRYNPPGF
jgi:hypothetical protein